MCRVMCWPVFRAPATPPPAEPPGPARSAGPDGPARRRLLAGLAATLLAPRPGQAATAPSAAEPATPQSLRDHALAAMRATDLSPSWFVSSNWGNRNYEPWTEYLVGRIGEAEFARVCANPSDYCLRDVWDLRRATPSRIDWAASVPFNWNGIHALALRFYRSGDDIYLHKWLAVVGDFAGWTLAQSARPDTPLTRGEPPALLDAALAWGGICTAWAIIAKGLRPTAPTASPFAAATGALQSGESDRLPAAAVADIATAFARGHALHLLRATTIGFCKRRRSWTPTATGHRLPSTPSAWSSAPP